MMKTCKCGKPILCKNKCSSCYHKKYDKKYYKNKEKLAIKRKRSADSHYRLYGKGKRNKYTGTNELEKPEQEIRD